MNKRRNLFLLPGLLLLGTLNLLGQAEFDSYLKSQEDNRYFKGSVFLYKNGEILLDKAYGNAHHEFDIKNTTDTKYLIGSISKSFTACAVLRIFAKRDLPLSSPISDFGYDFEGADKINIRHLLRHRSGLMDYPDLIETPNWERFSLLDEERTELIERVVGLGFKFSPGEGFRYSNTGYIILGSILEKLLDKDFSRIIEEEIVSPYSLRDTGVMGNRKMVAGLASGYTSDPYEIRKAAYIDMELPFASGNMYSTSQDLFRFYSALVADETIPQKWKEDLFPKKGEKYGYGWAKRMFFGKESYGHFGRMSGFVSSVVYLPEEDLFLSFIANEDNAKLYSITQDLLAIALGETYEMPLIRKLFPLKHKAYSPYLGEYEIKPGDIIKVFRDKDKYYIQETGQMRHEIFPYGEHKFFFSLLEFDLIFDEVLEGKAGKLMLRRKELEIIAERIP